LESHNHVGESIGNVEFHAESARRFRGAFDGKRGGEIDFLAENASAAEVRFRRSESALRHEVATASVRFFSLALGGGFAFARGEGEQRRAEDERAL
jgi:hypothetical protein